MKLIDYARLMDKPRLARRHGLWVCTGRGEHGFGNTPGEAFTHWQRAVSKSELRRLWVGVPGAPNPLHPNWPYGTRPTTGSQWQ